MIDLGNISGLKICFDNGKLIIDETLQAKCSVRSRSVSDLAEVWMKPGLMGEQIIYSTFMHLIRPEDERLFHQHHLDHGIVVMPPGLYGGEFAKLYGHFHPLLPDNLNSSAELHSILYGEGEFLLQEAWPPYDKVSDVILIHAKAGDNFIIPPNYGHVVINSSDNFLIYDGFLPADLKADYEPYRRFRGGAYYLILNIKNNMTDYLLNPNYRNLLALRKVSVTNKSKIDILKSYPSCYDAVINHIEYFDFINQPQKFKHEWRF